MKTGYSLERLEQYILAPLSYFKCQKCGHNQESCRGCSRCGRYGQRDLDYMEENCLNKIRCSNCLENHFTFSRTCNIYKREREIIQVKYRMKITIFLASRNVNSYMKDNIYNNNQLDKYWAHWKTTATRVKRLAQIPRTVKETIFGWNLSNRNKLNKKNPQQTPMQLPKNIYRRLVISNWNK